MPASTTKEMEMKTFLRMLVFLVFSVPAYAQHMPRECSTDQYVKMAEKQNPVFFAQRNQFFQKGGSIGAQGGNHHHGTDTNPSVHQESFALPGANLPAGGGLPPIFGNDTNEIVIPVVVHLLYYTAGQNLPDSRIHAQLAALNRDFSGLGSDLSRTPQHFRSVTGAPRFRFELAKRDPRGFATTGINRVKINRPSFRDNDEVKYQRTGGVDAWNAEAYFNIWVCDLEKNLLGYSSFPFWPKDRDGVVIDLSVFGDAGYISGQYNRGRTLVHETGHWLGLKHLWGDYFCGNDGIDDTPQQEKPNRGCPSGIVKSCGKNDFGDMYMNFMDFTDDACMYMFTQQQSFVMRQLFAPGGLRHSLLQSNALNGDGLLPPPVQGNVSSGNESPAVPEAWVNIYPNPVQSTLQVKMENMPIASDNTRPGVWTVRVIDQSGVLVYQMQTAQSIFSLPTQQFKSGFYFLEVFNDQRRFRKKFIRQ
jgi:hypothetical protein